jgi:phosphate transport system protein
VTITQTGLERELRELKREFLLMHNRTAHALTLAIGALLERDADKASRAIRGDSEIDEWRTRLERRCLELIAKHQLLARDARFVTGVLSSVADFERTGDYATHVANDATRSLLAPSELQPVTDLILGMLHDLGTGLREENAALIQSVAARDADVDALTATLNESLLEHHHVDQNALVAALRVLRGLQRIGDHLENVAERLVFWIDGSGTRVAGTSVAGTSVAGTRVTEIGVDGINRPS